MTKQSCLKFEFPRVNSHSLPHASDARVPQSDASVSITTQIVIAPESYRACPPDQSRKPLEFKAGKASKYRDNEPNSSREQLLRVIQVPPIKVPLCQQNPLVWPKFMHLVLSLKLQHPHLHK
jgi:hypothetical protein